MLLVIGLIVIIMAAAWPSFDRLWESRRLQEGAAQLRGILRDARRQAMADDLPYRVDVLPGTPQLRMVPSADDFEDEESTTAEPSMEETPEADFEPRREKFDLPEGVTVLSEEDFEKGPRQEEEGDATSEEPTMEQGVDESAPKWLPLCEFFPDGSASPVVIRLVDPRPYFVEIRVRELTGEVDVGEPEPWLSEEEKEENDLASSSEEAR